MSYLYRNLLKRVVLAFAFAVFSMAAVTLQSEAAGLLSPKDGSLPPLEVRDHMVDVVIDDGYAITRIEQVFINPNQSDLEAVYSFPVPDKAAVAEFTYWIDGKPISGEVLAKQKAREVYKKEKAAGRETAIAEQDGYRSFDISVWPVRAGKDVRVRLSYIQPAHVDTSVGRYAYPLEDGGVDEQKNAFWMTSDQVKGRFSFDLELRSSYPVQSIRLPAHPGAVIKRDAEGDWHVHLDNGVALNGGPSLGDDVVEQEETETSPVPGLPGEKIETAIRLDTDIVVYWKLQDGLPASVDMVAYKEADDKRGTFMMTLTPGDDLQPISEGRDWVFVLDVSGSMKGKFPTLAEGISQGLRKLTPKDRFRIVYFNDRAFSHGGFVNATPESKDQAMRRLANIYPERGTNLYAGLVHGLDNLDHDRSTGLILVTDGVANVGETHKRQFIKLVNKQDVRLFTLVMGNSANRPLLKAISLVSGGTAINVSNSDDVVGAVLSATSKLTHAALHDVKVEIDGVRTKDVQPTRIGSLYRGQQLVLFGHYWGSGEAKVRLKAKVSGKPVTFETTYMFPKTESRNPEIERLWAFASIEDLMQEMDLFGETDDVKQAATDIAVENSLVTPYTSMVVVREKVFAQYGINRLNRDRLAKEATAQKQRAAQPKNTQVAQNFKSFNNNRPSYAAPRPAGSGGGAIDPVVLLLLLVAAVPLFISRRRIPEMTS